MLTTVSTNVFKRSENLGITVRYILKTHNYSLHHSMKASPPHPYIAHRVEYSSASRQRNSLRGQASFACVLASRCLKPALTSCWQLLTCLLLLLPAACPPSVRTVASFLRSARPHGTMILRSVLPVIFRKRPCLVTLLLSLSCCLHSPRHSKPVYMESQFHSRQNPQFGWVGGEMGSLFTFLS